jgi:tetratricopeptide (TPR) repeat protein
MKGLNLETQFDSNLREIPVVPKDFEDAISQLKDQVREADMTLDTVKKLGQLANCQRVMGSLAEAEDNLRRAISLSVALNEPKFRLVNLIRLANTKHLQGEFSQAHQLFNECFAIIVHDDSLAEYLDFIYQHKGKCNFDELKYESALKQFYNALLIRNKKTDRDLADSTLLAIEETKRRWLPQVSQTQSEHLLSSPEMPAYVRSVLWKMHGKELVTAGQNCINAALGFHGIDHDRLTPFAPIDFLRFLIAQTEQIENVEDFRFGDLVVWWNRSEGAWANKKIIVENISFSDPDFPYGLIFDHVAVRISPEIVFNKPNPSPNSCYKFDFLDTASYPSKLGEGHEMTFHRLRRT